MNAVEIAHPIREFNRIIKGVYLTQEEAVEKIKELV